LATRARIMGARNAGTGVPLVPEDLDEILELADRIAVMHGERVADEMPAEGADPQEISRHMPGHH
jgi:general nucleoside transport system ATP-binding protein